MIFVNFPWVGGVDPLLTNFKNAILKDLDWGGYPPPIWGYPVAQIPLIMAQKQVQNRGVPLNRGGPSILKVKPSILGVKRGGSQYIEGQTQYIGGQKGGYPPL
jgi:hypothetical protein